MKKRCIYLLLLSLLFTNVPVFSMSVDESKVKGVIDLRVQPEQPADAPKWVEYVPVKYQNPRTDFNKGNAIAELTVGIILTDLIITSPIGIPMICHSTTKLKNIGWADKKEKFFDGLDKANTIADDEERAEYYKKLRSKCRMSDRNHAKQLKRIAKAEAKNIDKD